MLINNNVAAPGAGHKSVSIIVTPHCTHTNIRTHSHSTNNRTTVVCVYGRMDRPVERTEPKTEHTTANVVHRTYYSIFPWCAVKGGDKHTIDACPLCSPAHSSTTTTTTTTTMTFVCECVLECRRTFAGTRLLCCASLKHAHDERHCCHYWPNERRCSKVHIPAYSGRA